MGCRAVSEKEQDATPLRCIQKNEGEIALEKRVLKMMLDDCFVLRRNHNDLDSRKEEKPGSGRLAEPLVAADHDEQCASG